MMKRENDNLFSDESAQQLDKNLSRLLKLTGKSDKPSRTFTKSLINDALNELKQLVGKSSWLGCYGRSGLGCGFCCYHILFLESEFTVRSHCRTNHCL
jgi:hypothetical protein